MTQSLLEHLKMDPKNPDSSSNATQKWPKFYNTFEKAPEKIKIPLVTRIKNDPNSAGPLIYLGRGPKFNCRWARLHQLPNVWPHRVNTLIRQIYGGQHAAIAHLQLPASGFVFFYRLAADVRSATWTNSNAQVSAPVCYLFNLYFSYLLHVWTKMM